MSKIILFSLVFANALFAQFETYEGPDDPSGDPNAVLSGYLEGNRVLLKYQNTTELSDWPSPTAAHQWPWPHPPGEVAELSDGIGFPVFFSPQSFN